VPPQTHIWCHNFNKVAQTFHIPFVFEFRRVDVRWVQASAQIIQWRRHEDGTVDPLHLIAEIEGDVGKYQIGLPVRYLPEGERKRCVASAGRRDADEVLRRVCSSVRIAGFTHNRKTYIGESDIIKHSVPADVLEMWKDFVRLKADAESALDFLNSWGRWVPLKNFVALSELLELQEDVRHAVTVSSARWLSSPLSDLPRARSRSTEVPHFRILTDACEVAIRMATTIHLLRGIKFRICARPDCAAPFPVESKRNQTYCQKYCAHLESVRRGRIAQRSA
jgi:hypothetical protein